MYKKRLKRYKKLLLIASGEDRIYINQVIETIEHLMVCKEAHSWKKARTGLKMCREFGV